MYLLIVFLTLVSSLIVGFFGRFFGFYGSALLSTSCLLVAFFISLFLFYEVAFVGCFSYLKLISWMTSETLNVDWGFMFDSLTVVMCCVVTFISSLVHLYSSEYMSHDPHLPRFMSYLSLFTFFMLLLVTADNFIQMFVGWEGVGLCSCVIALIISLIVLRLCLVIIFVLKHFPLLIKEMRLTVAGMKVT